MRRLDPGARHLGTPRFEDRAPVTPGASAHSSPRDRVGGMMVSFKEGGPVAPCPAPQPCAGVKLESRHDESRGTLSDVRIRHHGVASRSCGRGRKKSHFRTGWRGYRSETRGHQMKTLVEVLTYFGGAAHRWHSDSGNGTEVSGRGRPPARPSVMARPTGRTDGALSPSRT